MNRTLTYDPVADLRHYPVPLARFGRNPYGANLYRIVFAPSRRHLVCGRWPDGSDHAAYVGRYGALGEKWVMEKWLSAAEYAGPQDRWDLVLGPYPARGEYELCHVFDGILVDELSLEKLIGMIEAGRRTRFAEKVTAHRRDAEREKKAIRDQQEAMIRNRLPAFGVAPLVGYGGRRGSKTVPILRTAEELGLPASAGKIRTRNQRGPQFEVKVKVA